MPRWSRSWHHVHRRIGLVRIHAGERLIEQQDLGLGCHRDGDAECPQIAVRQVARPLVHDVAEPEIGQDLGRAVAEAMLVVTRGRGREIDARARSVQPQMMATTTTFSRAVISLKMVVSWKVRTTPLRATACGGSPLIARPRKRPGRCRRQEGGDQLEQRAFPGAVRADHREDLAILDVEADIVHRDQAAEALG